MANHLCSSSNVLIMDFAWLEPFRPSKGMEQMSSLEKPGVYQQLEAVIQLDIGGSRRPDAEEGRADDPDLDDHLTVLVEPTDGSHIVPAGVVQMDR